MSEIPDKPGIYRNVPFDDYMVIKAVPSSFLKDMDHTAHLARWNADHSEAEKECYKKGRLFHALSLEPDAAEKLFIGKPGEYHHPDDEAGVMRKWNGNAGVCKEWEKVQACAGRTVVSQDVMAETLGMAQAVRSHPDMRPFLSDADVELTVLWTDKMTGLLCKARFDGYKNWTVIDLKSTSGSAARERFPYEAAQYRYAIQAAHYMDALETIDCPCMPSGDPVRPSPLFRFIAVEGYAPFDLQTFDVEDDPDAGSWDFLEYGRCRRAILMGNVKHCLETGEWPGYPVDAADMTLTPNQVKELEVMKGMVRA